MANSPKLYEVHSFSSYNLTHVSALPC